MNYTITEQGGVVIVDLDGQVNYASSPMFKKLMEKLVGFKGRKIVFALGKVSHVDSVGLGFLYVAKSELAAPEQPLVLQGAQPGVMKLLQLTEAYTDFDIQP